MASSLIGNIFGSGFQIASGTQTAVTRQKPSSSVIIDAEKYEQLVTDAAIATLDAVLKSAEPVRVHINETEDQTASVTIPEIIVPREHQPSRVLEILVYERRRPTGSANDEIIFSLARGLTVGRRSDPNEENAIRLQIAVFGPLYALLFHDGELLFGRNLTDWKFVAPYPPTVRHIEVSDFLLAMGSSTSSVYIATVK